MTGNGVRSPRRFSCKTFWLVFLAAAFISPVQAADTGSPVPDLAGQWGRDMLFFEPPSSGPGPVIRADRNADGSMVVQDPCCTLVQRWLGDAASPILKPAAAEAVKKFAELSLSGTVVPDLHNMCWPEPPPYVMGLHFGLHILQKKDEVTLIYLLYNTVRHVRLNVSHPENPAPSWQGHSVGWYDGDTLVIDTVGIKEAPLSTIDPFGTPHSEALHVVERYRLIDGEAAAAHQKKHGAVFRGAPPYGRGTIDPDTSKPGLQIEFTVDDANVFTTPWSGRVTYRRLVGGWPEAVCVENPQFTGSEAAMPTAHISDF